MDKDALTKHLAEMISGAVRDFRKAMRKLDDDARGGADLVKLRELLEAADTIEEFERVVGSLPSAPPKPKPVAPDWAVARGWTLNSRRPEIHNGVMFRSYSTRHLSNSYGNRRSVLASDDGEIVIDKSGAMFTASVSGVHLPKKFRYESTAIAAALKARAKIAGKSTPSG